MIFQNIIQAQPLLSIIVVSLIVTLILTWVYKLLIDQEKMKSLKEKTKELQKQLKTEKDTEKIMQINKEMLQMSGEQMKMSFKPMLITYVPLIVFWAFLRGLYTGVGDLITWGFNLPLVGTGAGWLLSYLIFSIAFSMIWRKILKVQ